MKSNSYTIEEPLKALSQLTFNYSRDKLRTDVAVAVNIEQQVVKGEPICVGEYLSIHSPVCGTVTNISDTEITISQRDCTEEPYNLQLPKIKDDVAKYAAAIGLVGMGGSMFPSAIKLKAAKESKVHTLIINAVECEPYITIDEALLQNELQYIQAGAKVLSEALNIKDVQIAAQKQVIKRNNELFKNIGYKVLQMPTKYPTGAERLILKKATGKNHSASTLPFQVGYLINNVTTLWALGKSILDGSPVINRPLTVIWDNNSSYKNIIVPVGANISEVLRATIGRDVYDSELIIAGGLMMGHEVDINSNIQKGTNALFIIKRIDHENVEACKKCGRCVEACPLNLSPTTIVHQLKQSNKVGKYIQKHIDTCFLCGACNASCPSRINLVKHIKEAKR